MGQDFINYTYYEIVQELEKEYLDKSLRDSLVNVIDWTLQNGESEIDSVFTLFCDPGNDSILSIEFHFDRYANLCDSIVLILSPEIKAEPYFAELVMKQFYPLLCLGDFDVIDQRRTGSFKPKDGKKEVDRRRIKLHQTETSNYVCIWNFGLTRKELRVLNRE